MTQKPRIVRILVWLFFAFELAGFVLSWSPLVLRDIGFTMQLAPRGLAFAEARNLLLPQRLAGAGLGVVALLVMLFGLWHLDCMLRSLRKEAIFSLANIAHLRRFVGCVGLSTALSILEVPLRSLLFRFALPELGGPVKLVKTEMASGDFALLLFCLVFYLIIDMMHQARRIARENEAFI